MRRANILQRWWIKKRIELLQEFLPLIKGKIIIDVGGNDGFLEEQLRIDAIVCDRELNLLRSDFSSVLCDALRLPFKRAVVDVVICSHTLEHVDPILALREFEFVLKKEGLCILIVPYVHPYWKLRELTLPFEHKPFDLKRIQRLLSKTGFEPFSWKVFALGLDLFVIAKKRNLDKTWHLCQ